MIFLRYPHIVGGPKATLDIRQPFLAGEENLVALTQRPERKGKPTS